MSDSAFFAETLTVASGDKDISAPGGDDGVKVLKLQWFDADAPDGFGVAEEDRGTFESVIFAFHFNFYLDAQSFGKSLLDHRGGFFQKHFNAGIGVFSGDHDPDSAVLAQFNGGDSLRSTAPASTQQQCCGAEQKQDFLHIKFLFVNNLNNKLHIT